MARNKLLTVIAIAALLVSAALIAYAQGGPGRGRCAGTGQGYGTGQCVWAQGSNPQACWWTQVKAKTPQQQAFINDVASLHDQIKAKMLQLATLLAQNATQADITSAQGQLDQLRTQLRTTMTKNADICTALGVPNCATCTGCPCGYCGYGGCPGAGCGLGLGMGGWWNWVQPQTDAQKAFVADVKSLHDQIAAAQIAGDQTLTASLRTKLHDLMYNNVALHQQLMLSIRSANGTGYGRGMGTGCRGAGRGMCGCPMWQ